LAKKLDTAMKMYTDKPTDELAYFTGYHKFRRLAAKDFAESKASAEGRSERPEPGVASNDGFMSIPEGLENDLPFK